MPTWDQVICCREFAGNHNSATETTDANQNDLILDCSLFLLKKKKGSFNCRLIKPYRTPLLRMNPQMKVKVAKTYLTLKIEAKSLNSCMKLNY